MIDQSPPPRSQRVGVLISVVSLHMALLAAFLARGNATLPPLVKSEVMSLVAIKPNVAAQRPPPPPELPSKLVDEIKKLAAPAPAMEPDSAALDAPAGQCATLDVVTDAIVADRLAVASVFHAPPETRSIADAIVMWNAGWSSAASTLESPLSPARAAVEKGLSLVEDNCLDEPIAGPRLIPVPVPDTQRTMFLVFGSGSWTWRQLIADPAAAEVMAQGEQRPKQWYEVDWF